MKLIILVGKPGSGKSTLATTEFKDYIRISQDELGSKFQCLKLCNDSLAEGKDIIIDRCNHTVQQRKEWLKMARLYGASTQAVYLDASHELCVKRISTRENHPTIDPKTMGLDKLHRIVRQFNNDLVVPTLDEDFDSILHIRVRS